MVLSKSFFHFFIMHVSWQRRYILGELPNYTFT